MRPNGNGSYCTDNIPQHHRQHLTNSSSFGLKNFPPQQQQQQQQLQIASNHVQHAGGHWNPSYNAPPHVNHINHMSQQSYTNAAGPSSTHLNHAHNMHPHVRPQPQQMGPGSMFGHSNPFPSTSSSSHNYAKLPPPSALNQQRINECAGIPLISNNHLNAGQRQRLQKANKNPMSCSKQPQEPLRAVNQPNNWSASFRPVAGVNGIAHASIAQLAAHAQGAPLLLQQKSLPPTWNNSCPNGNVNSASYGRQRFMPTRRSSPSINHRLDKLRPPLRYQNSAPAALSSRTKENQLKDSKQQLEEDNAKEMPEQCLPRIIKPRKRRKKDRKPAQGVFVKLDDDTNSQLPEEALNSLQFCNTQPGQTAQFQPKANARTLDLSNNRSPLSSISSCFSDYGCLNKQSNEESGGICFCPNCDPLRCIWDYPLRRSLSDSSSSSGCSSSSASSYSNTASSSNSSLERQTPHESRSRAEIVGVIGSQRHNAANSMAEQFPAKNNNHSTCLSDSNDSAYGDILVGLNIATNLFGCQTTNFNNNTKLQSSSLLLPETAETLLNASINEISRQLMETCNNEPPSQSVTNKLSADYACSQLSDSGLDSAGSHTSPKANQFNELIFNFDQLNMLDAGNGATAPSFKCHESSLGMGMTECSFSIPKPPMPSVPKTPTLDFMVDLNNNKPSNGKGLLSQSEQFSQQHQQQQPQTTSSSSAQTTGSSSNSTCIKPDYKHQHHLQQQQQQHQQQFLYNCLDFVWQDNEEAAFNTDSIKCNELNALSHLKRAFSTLS